MPKVEVNYQNGLIYQIVCHDVNVKECYVGSTTNFVKRKSAHKSTCNNANGKCYNLNVYKFIRENGGWDNWNMVLIEYYACDNNLDLHKRERYYVESKHAALNKNIPTRTLKEYRVDNKETISQKKKEYCDAHRESIAHYNKNYKIANVESVKLLKRKYYVSNKEALLTKHICICGGSFKTMNRTHHTKTKKHVKFLATVE